MQSKPPLIRAGWVLLVLALAGCSKSSNFCVNNLRIIESSKEMWHRENPGITNDLPTWRDIQPYLPLWMSNGMPRCPGGGIYSLHRIGEQPTCSVGGPGHSLPRD